MDVLTTSLQGHSEQRRKSIVVRHNQVLFLIANLSSKNQIYTISIILWGNPAKGGATPESPNVIRDSRRVLPRLRSGSLARMTRGAKLMMNTILAWFINLNIVF